MSHILVNDLNGVSHELVPCLSCISEKRKGDAVRFMPRDTKVFIGCDWCGYTIQPCKATAHAVLRWNLANQK